MPTFPRRDADPEDSTPPPDALHRFLRALPLIFFLFALAWFLAPRFVLPRVSESFNAYVVGYGLGYLAHKARGWLK